MAPILPPLTMALLCSFCFIMPLFASNPRSIILKAGAHALLVEAAIHRNKNDVDLLVIPGNGYAESGDVQRAAVLMALSGLQQDEKEFDVRPVERLCFNSNLLLRSSTRPWQEVLMRSPVLPMDESVCPEYTWPVFGPNEKVTLISHLDFGVYHGLAPLYNEAVGHIFKEKPSFNIHDIAIAMERGVETIEFLKPITIRMRPASLGVIRWQNTVLNEPLFKRQLEKHGIDDALWEQVKFYLDDDPYLGRNAALSQKDFMSAVSYKFKTKVKWGQLNELWGIEGLTISQRWSRLRRNKKIKFKKLERVLIRAHEDYAVEDDTNMDCYESCSEDSECSESSGESA